MEHILPESLGNTTRTLKPGVVCDKCNNYFSRDVERPFLEAPAIAALRFHQSIPSKRGRIPPLGAVLMPGIPATLHRFPKHGVQAVSLPPEGIDRLQQTRRDVVRGWNAIRNLLLGEGRSQLADDVRTFVNQMPPPCSEKAWLAYELIEQVRRARSKDKPLVP